MPRDLFDYCFSAHDLHKNSLKLAVTRTINVNVVVLVLTLAWALEEATRKQHKRRKPNASHTLRPHRQLLGLAYSDIPQVDELFVERVIRLPALP